MAKEYARNSLLENQILPVDIVLHPAWWFHNAGITFDEDFFYHPVKRVEVERKMEGVLWERFGGYGMGEKRGEEQPVVGAVHQAAGFLVSEMLGCKVEYKEDAAPEVIPAELEGPEAKAGEPFDSAAWKRFEKLTGALDKKYGYLLGDVNWSGILNVALDLRGQNLFMDMLDSAEKVKTFFTDIAGVMSEFTARIQRLTGTSSISVNRNVRHFSKDVFLHSECSHTMISVEDYRNSLMQFDMEWSRTRRPFGIHYCGSDPHRYAEVFSELPHLDFLDLGWGGDVGLIRKHLPGTFLNIRLSPVELIEMAPGDISELVVKLVEASGNPWLTGVCCVNMDEKVSDEKIIAILDTAAQCREKYLKDNNDC